MLQQGRSHCALLCCCVHTAHAHEGMPSFAGASMCVCSFAGLSHVLGCTAPCCTLIKAHCDWGLLISPSSPVQDMCEGLVGNCCSACGCRLWKQCAWLCTCSRSPISLRQRSPIRAFIAVDPCCVLDYTYSYIACSATLPVALFSCLLYNCQQSFMYLAESCLC
jgi:hypothetical protein